MGPFQAPGRSGQRLAAQLPVLCVSVCLPVAAMPGLGAEQRYSLSSWVVAEIRIKFWFSKETLCVYFKS